MAAPAKPAAGGGGGDTAFSVDDPAFSDDHFRMFQV
jgi:hypothetical protein